MPANTLPQRIRSMGDELSVFADKVDPSARIFSIFSRQPPREYVYIIVASSEWEPPRLSVTFHHHHLLPSPIVHSMAQNQVYNICLGRHILLMLFTDDRFLALHNSFWKRGEDRFVRHSVLIPDPLSLDVESDSETLGLTIIDLPKGFFEVSKLLVVEIYKTFWDLLNSEDQHWETLLQTPGRYHSLHHSTIFTGQPGIGQYAIAYIFF